MQSLSDWQSQKLLKAAMSFNHGLVVLDPEARIAWTNPAVEMLLGWSWSELEGCPVTKLVAPSSLEDVPAWGLQAKQGRPLRALRVRGVRKDGMEREIEFELVPVPDSHGGPDGGAIVFRDVTEDALDGRELVRLRGHFHVGFVQGFAPQAFLDVEGRFVDVNEAACALLRQSADQLLGRSALEFLDPLDPIRLVNLADALERPDPSRRRHEVIARDARGRQLPLLLEVTSLVGREGEHQGFACFATDLSDVRDAEQRLAGQEVFYRALNRSASDVAIVSDAIGTLVYVSPSAQDLLGYDPADVIAGSGFDFVHPDDQPIAEALVASALGAPHRKARALLRIRHATGGWRWMEETVTNALEDPDVGGLVANLSDVTERVEAQVALQRSEARYRAIAEAAHEGIIALDSNGDTMFANDRLAELVGYSIAEIYDERALVRLRPRRGATAAPAVPAGRRARPGTLRAAVHPQRRRATHSERLGEPLGVRRRRRGARHGQRRHSRTAGGEGAAPAGPARLAHRTAQPVAALGPAGLSSRSSVAVRRAWPGDAVR